MAAPTTESAVASTAKADARWRPTPLAMRRFALAALIANIGIVATGGLVRLTNSGLGCPDWPACSGGSLVATGKVSWHKAVENTNRGLTVVIMVAVAAAFIAAYRERPARPTVRRWAWVTLLGVPAQAVLGGVTVRTHLNPWVVSAHFMLSMTLVGAATVLWWNTRTPTPEPSAVAPSVPLLLRRLGGATWVLTYVVFAVGTLVTGSGPHAGDAKAVRLPLRPQAISQLHADLVMLLVGAAAVLAVCVTALAAPPAARLATRLLIGALAIQAAIGFAQYFSGLPILLVELHLTGAAILAATVTGVVLALGSPLGSPVEPAQRYA